jgi:hypothetical protein
MNENPAEKKYSGWKIENSTGRDDLFGKFFSFRKNQMKQKRRKNHKGDFICPVEGIIKKIKMPGRREYMKAVKGKRYQKKEYIREGKSFSCIQEHDKAYHQSGQPYQSQIKIDQAGSLSCD